jgi:hypothetical protein
MNTYSYVGSNNLSITVIFYGKKKKKEQKKRNSVFDNRNTYLQALAM